MNKLSNNNKGKDETLDVDKQRTIEPLDPSRNPLLDLREDSVLTDKEDRENALKDSYDKLNDLVKDQKIAVVATKCDDHGIVSRPMYTVDKDFDGTLWFFTTEDSTIVKQVEFNKLINVMYFDNDFVSFSGTGEVIVDTQKNRELWNPAIEEFLQAKPESNKVRLIKVTPDYAEYWDNKNKLAQAFNMIKSKITDEKPDVGDHEKINI